ncbi:Protein CBG00988 [Caenorhabditis briggsae]|uniref:Uncharacterized protein n=2 Tax=Caenorhabditis briggsae TaxID=6238 RepID=A0AAE9DHK3_CAEBR|nr:Protein CBG00988 [Caenorhabditis briggsae]ULU03658.1 hypothetical protein L3Y34_016860 [Caenorhabditis briggsae]UMM15664.1 hypothetical protein L5515_013014 [Caenorhabditis briggsae]CAP22266.1 Protein CBG00988 [Caenorhabditis briggsae]
MNLGFILIVSFVIGSVIAAPLHVEYVLAPVPLKQKTDDKSKLIAIVPLNTSTIVIKFDKPFLAEIEKTSEFSANFDQALVGKESPIVKLLTKPGSLEKPVVVNIKDTKNGDSVKVMITKEAGAQ